MSSTPNIPIVKPAADTVMVLALVLAAILWGTQEHLPRGGLENILNVHLTLFHAFFGVVFVIIWRFCFDAVDTCRGKRSAAFLRTIVTYVATVGIVGFFLKSRGLDGSVSRILVLAVFATFAYHGLRLLVRSRVRTHSPRTKKVIILGSGRRASKAWRELRTREFGVKTVLGFVDDRSPSSMAPDIAGRYLGRIDELSAYLFCHPVDELIVASPLQSEYAMTQRAITIAEAAGIRVLCLDDVFTLATVRTSGQQVSLLREIVPRKRAS